MINTKEFTVELIRSGYKTSRGLSIASDVSEQTISKIRAGILPSAQVIQKIGDTMRLSPERIGAIFFARNID